jgi:hypothetical protein
MEPERHGRRRASIEQRDLIISSILDYLTHIHGELIKKKVGPRVQILVQFTWLTENKINIQDSDFVRETLYPSGFRAAKMATGPPPGPQGLLAEALVREYLVSVRASAASCRRAVCARGTCACGAAVLCRADDARQRCSARHGTG